MTNQRRSWNDQPETFLKWPIRDYLEMANQRRSWYGQSETFLKWPIRDCLQMTNQSRSWNDQSGSFFRWPIRVSLANSSVHEVRNSWKIWRLKRIYLSVIAVKGTPLYTGSCDGRRWLTAGVILFYRRRNSVLLFKRHAVDDEKCAVNSTFYWRT